MSRQKIAHGLRRRVVISSPQFKGQPFVFPLELHARQHVLPAEIFGFDIAQQRSVGVFAVAGKLAHAIGHHAAIHRGRRHHAPGHMQKVYADRPVGRWQESL